MSTRVGIVVHGADAALGDALVGALATADRLGEVRAVEAVPRDESIAPAATRLAEVAEVVVGLGALPFPGLAARHDATRDALGDLPYWAVETWHGLPAHAEALAAAVTPVLTSTPGDPHVLVTAPDVVIRPLPPEHRVVLRDVAAALAERLGRRPTVAVDRSPATGGVTPTAVGTLGTLVDAHGATAVVRCSLVPADDPDPALVEEAAARGVTLRDVSLDRATHVRLLLDAAATVLEQAVAGGAGGGHGEEGAA